MESIKIGTHLGEGFGFGFGGGTYRRLLDLETGMAAIVPAVPGAG